MLPLVTRCLLKRELRWIPLIFVLWANLHAGFMLGLAVVAVAAAAIIMQDRSSWRALAWTLGLSTVGTFVNPLGMKLWTTVFESMGRSSLIGITEFRPAQLSAPEDGAFWIVALILTALSLWRARRIWKEPAWPLIATSLALIPVAFRYSRNIPLFLLLAVPAISLPALRLTAASPTPRARREHPTLNAVLLTSVFVLVGCAVTFAWRTPIQRLQWKPMSSGAIAALAQCPAQIYNRYDDGGYLLWFSPSRRVFVDSRQDPYPLEFLQEHLRTEHSGDYVGTFARYGIHCAFLPPESPVARSLQRDHWVTLYRDAEWVVLRDANPRRD
jgi:hypothetical protein